MKRGDRGVRVVAMCDVLQKTLMKLQEMNPARKEGESWMRKERRDGEEGSDAKRVTEFCCGDPRFFFTATRTPRPYLGVNLGTT